MKNWETITTVALTATTTILAGLGAITADEAAKLSATGAAAVAGVLAFAAAVAACVKAHRKGGGDGDGKAA